jgi:3',5'-cyclic-AMP phosphodiesterase
MTDHPTQTEALIIAQISDLHIKRPGELAYGKVDTAAALRRMIDVLNALSPKPRLVVVSGDLVDGGTREEYDHLLGLLEALDLPLCFMPGNHDAREPMRAAFNDQAFIAGTALNQIQQIGSLDVIALDSSVPGKPHGELGGETLDWLDATLASNADRPALVFLHHPPFRTGIWHMDRQNLTDAAALAKVLNRHHRVRLLGCGHVHRHVASTFAGRPVIICPGASHAVALDLDQSMEPSFRLETPGLLMHSWDHTTDSLVSHALNVDAPHLAYPFFNKAGELL